MMGLGKRKNKIKASPLRRIAFDDADLVIPGRELLILSANLWNPVAQNLNREARQESPLRTQSREMRTPPEPRPGSLLGVPVAGLLGRGN